MSAHRSAAEPSTPRAGLRAGLFGTGDSVRVRCDLDDWEFAPRYTDGACPLCGWRPDGVTLETPVIQRIDWFLVLLAVVVVASIVIGIVVVHAYTQVQGVAS